MNIKSTCTFTHHKDVFSCQDHELRHGATAHGIPASPLGMVMSCFYLVTKNKEGIHESRLVSKTWYIIHGY